MLWACLAASAVIAWRHGDGQASGVPVCGFDDAHSLGGRAAHGDVLLQAGHVCGRLGVCVGHRNTRG